MKCLVITGSWGFTFKAVVQLQKKEKKKNLSIHLADSVKAKGRKSSSWTVERRQKDDGERDLYTEINHTDVTCL